MKKFLLGGVVAVVGFSMLLFSQELARITTAWAANAACNIDNCQEQGGSRWSVGGSIDVLTGGDLDIESGGTFKIAGSTVSATAAELNLMNGVTATTVELNRAADVSTRIVTATAATLLVTEALHDGKIITLDRVGGTVITMPEATGSGMVIEFLVITTMTTDTTIVLPDTVNTDLQGFAVISDDADNTTESQFIPAATEDLVTLNGGTTGGLLGTRIKYIDIATDLWHVEIYDRTGAATQATPFSST